MRKSARNVEKQRTTQQQLEVDALRKLRAEPRRTTDPDDLVGKRVSAIFEHRGTNGRFAGVVYCKNDNNTYVVHFDDGDVQTDVKRREMSLLLDQSAPPNKNARLAMLVLTARKVLDCCQSTSDTPAPKVPSPSASSDGTVQASAAQAKETADVSIEAALPNTSVQQVQRPVEHPKPKPLDAKENSDMAATQIVDREKLLLHRVVSVRSLEFLRKLFVQGQEASPRVSFTKTVTYMRRMSDLLADGGKDDDIKRYFLDRELVNEVPSSWPVAPELPANSTTTSWLYVCNPNEFFKKIITTQGFKQTCDPLIVKFPTALNIEKAKRFADETFDAMVAYENHPDFRVFEENAPHCATAILSVTPCFLFVIMLKRFDNLKTAKVLAQAVKKNCGDLLEMRKFYSLFSRLVSAMAVCMAITMEERCAFVRESARPKQLLMLPPKKRARTHVS